MKYLITITLIFNLMGCANSSKHVPFNNFVVKDISSQYGMKYHFILETKDKISDMHNPLSKFSLITHYHIYTNSLGKISGDKLLFSKYDNTQPKKLTQNSTFTFTSHNIIIEGLQWCSNVYPHCENILHGKYLIKTHSLLNSENHQIDNISDKGYFK